MTQQNNSKLSFLDFIKYIFWFILVTIIIKFLLDQIEIASQQELSLIDVLNS